MESGRLVTTFVREAEELLESLEKDLLELEADPASSEVVDRLFRAAHTIKGNAGMVGFAEAVRLTHALEHVLDQVRSRTLIAGPDVVAALFRGVDLLGALTRDFSNGKVNGPSEAQEALVLELLAMSGESDENAPGISRLLEVTLYPRKDSFGFTEDIAQLLTDLRYLGEVVSVETLFDRVRPLGEGEGEGGLGLRVRLETESGPMGIMGVCFLSVDEEDLSIVDLRGSSEVYSLDRAADKKEEKRAAVPRQLETGNSPKKEAAAGEKKSSAGSGSTLRVETEKLDRLMDLIGELVIGISQVRAQHTREHESNDDSAVEQLELLGRELQDQVMTLRMLPIQETFDRFRRPIRDLAKELGKPLDFRVSGGDTQVDKRVVDQLVDPLKHMLRNCVSHGLETESERIANGKPALGTIALSATQREGHVIIEIKDDGRGIDAGRVRRKAEEKGLVSPGQELSTSQTYELIFLPGFSTAEAVNEISGRGVGLDVVRKNIQALRGSVEIDSVLGRGTTFRIRLPLTLGIIDGMNVKIGEETVTIPLQNVVELIAPEERTIRTLEKKNEFIDVRGELVPVVRLHEMLALEGGHLDEKDLRVVLVETERRKFGLVVDRVVGMGQTVIKPLDRSYRLVERMDVKYDRPRGIGGAVILGDGSVGLILDVHGLETFAFEAA